MKLVMQMLSLMQSPRVQKEILVRSDCQKYIVKIITSINCNNNSIVLCMNNKKTVNGGAKCIAIVIDFQRIIAVILVDPKKYCNSY